MENLVSETLEANSVDLINTFIKKLIRSLLRLLFAQEIS